MEEIQVKLSVVTVNLNNRAGLERTIQSVLSQNAKGFEFVVIDGGSTDGSRELLEKYRQWIDVFMSENDRGIYHGMNKGIAASSGDYLLFLNSGDTLFDDRVTSAFSLNEFSEDFIFFDYVRLRENGEELMSYSDPTFEFLILGAVCHQSVLHKRDVFLNIGKYNEHLQIAADYEFFLRAFYQHDSTFRFVKQKLVAYDDVVGKSKDMELLRRERRLALESVFDSRVVNVLEKQSNTINELFTYRDRYNGLLNSKSVSLALRVSSIWKSVIDLRRNRL